MALSKPLALASLVALATLAGCATTSHGNLVRSADRLERSADDLARNDRSMRYGVSYTREARQLADETHDFRRTIQDERADSRDVDAAFEDVSRSYHALRDDVDHSTDRDAQLDLRPVTDAYLDMEREMGGYRGADRYRYSDTRRDEDYPRNR
jgi:hypothetical protein